MPQLYWPFPLSTVTEWPASAGRPNHWGTDFGIPQGTPLRATVDGVIVRHNNDGLGAYVLDIISDDGLLVRNGHLSRMDVNTGQRVTAGQVIGLTGGQPGTPGAGMSTGPHLHWELRWDRAWSGGRWVDPRRMTPPILMFGEVPDSVDEEDEEMAKTAGFYYKKADGKLIAVLVNPVSGFFHEYETEKTTDYNSGVARAFETGSFETISESHARKLQADCALVRKGA